MLENQRAAVGLRPTGDVPLPGWAFAAEVGAWVQLLTDRDIRKAGKVKIYEGYTETAYRYVFPHKQQYSDKQKELQNLITILPSGKRENDEKLLHNDEAGLISYTRCQTMEDEELAKRLFDVDPFVWLRENGSFAVVQTWPVEINAKFKETFEQVETVDAEHFDPTAMNEFKRSMKKLFKLQENEDVEVMSVKRNNENGQPVYVGKGDALMAMLRISEEIRNSLMITSLAEPDGLECQWTCEDRKGTRVWHMDLTLEYCLYLKQGWDTMACVKPKEQFDWDSKLKGDGKAFCLPGSENKMLPYVMNLDWFASEAYPWLLTSTVFVWTCAFLTVLLRWSGSALSWDWVNNPAVLWVATGIASLFALYADFSAMKWCVVPWLQKVQLAVMHYPVWFHIFLMVQLFGTFLQIVTIQSNAWFMVTAVQNNDAMLDMWGHLWAKSIFGFLPEGAWKVFTPKLVAILLWFLSTTQLILPLMFSARLPGSARSPFPTRNADEAHVTESAEIVIKQERQGQQEDETDLLEEGKGNAQAFEPELFSFDFSTCWSTLVKKGLELWGFHAKECTYRESVADLALASGLRYTGSMALSYPTRRIHEIIKFQEGYNLITKYGLEPAPQGWELRSLMEFLKLARCYGSRVFFIMFCKLALQMNLQITFIVILRVQQQRRVFQGDMESITVMEVISIASLFLTFCEELLNAIWLIRTFCCVIRAVRTTVLQVGDSSKAYAHNDFFVHEKGEKSEQRVIYSGKDLKAEYYMAVRYFLKIMLIIILSAWLVGYAILKVTCAEVCKHGAWAWESGCLPPLGKAEVEPASSCFESFF